LSQILIDRVIEDARNVLKVVRDKRTMLNVYVASDQARGYFTELVSARQKKENVGAIVKKNAALRMPPDRVFKLVYELGEELTGKLLAQRKFDEHSTLSSASRFMSKELGIEVKVQKAGEKDMRDPGGRSKDALPMKPALYLE